MAAQDRRYRSASLFALTGGLLQVSVALSILFLPVLGACWMPEGGQLICGRQSYVQTGGNAVGYGVLSLMMGMGILVLVTQKTAYRQRAQLVRWVGAIVSLAVTVITLWGFGLTFLPGTLLLLISALLTRPSAAPTFPTR
jgi:hypothetical protein